MNNKIGQLNILHILNDGYWASLPLLLPFIAKDIGLSLSQVGFLGTILNSLGVFLAIPAGYIAAKYGGQKILIICTLLYAVGFLGASVSFSFTSLIVAFLVSGLGFGVFHPIAFSQVAKLSDKRKKGQQMGNFTAIGDIGRISFVSGITYLIVYFGWRNTAISYGISAIIAFIVLSILQKNKVEKDKIESKYAHSNTSVSEMIKNKKMVLAIFSGALDALASSSIFIFLPFLLISKGMSPEILGALTAMFFVGNFLGKSLLGRVVDRYRHTHIFIISEILMAIFIYGLAVSTSIIQIVVFSVLLGALTKGTVPVAIIMFSDSVGENEYEKTFGLNAFITSIFSTAAPLLLGIIAQKFGINYAFYFSALAALAAIIPTIFLNWEFKKETEAIRN